MNDFAQVGPPLEVLNTVTGQNQGSLPGGSGDIIVEFNAPGAAATVHDQRMVRLPKLGPELGTPLLFANHGLNDWRRVPVQFFRRSAIQANISNYGFYQVYAPILTLPFAFGEVYVFPSPVREGQTPTLHIEVGQAQSVSYRVYDVSGELRDEGEINTPPIIIDGKLAYEQSLTLLPPGVYIVDVTAQKTGRETVRKNTRFAIISR